MSSLDIETADAATCARACRALLSMLGLLLPRWRRSTGVACEVPDTAPRSA